jgi:hypothetical protein
MAGRDMCTVVSDLDASTTKPIGRIANCWCYWSFQQSRPEVLPLGGLCVSLTGGNSQAFLTFCCRTKVTGLEHLYNAWREDNRTDRGILTGIAVSLYLLTIFDALLSLQPYLCVGEQHTTV